MEIIHQEDLIKIKGGAKLSLIFGISAAVTFIIGIIDGLVRPLACRK